MSRHTRLARATAIVGSLLGGLLVAGCKDEVGPAAPITITAVSPTSDLLGGGTSVTITGSNFINVTSVTIGGNELGSRTVVTATQITGTTPAASELGASDVVVSSSSNGNGTCKGCFRYLLPVLARPLAAGLEHTCALTSGGAAYCWGRNDAGQLGDGSTTTSSSIPVAVSGGLTFSAIAAGYWHTCGLTTAGAVYCWGYSDQGQLGNGSTTYSLAPVAVSGGLTFSAIAIGEAASHTCGLTDVGAAYCWGRNLEGELGNGSRTSTSTPVAVSGGLTFRAMAAGGLHGCALTTLGEAYCWGSNSLGQLGIETGTGPETCLRPGPHPPRGTDDCSTLPIRVSTARHWSDLAAGFVHTCGWTPGGQGYCWGYNLLGQLGDGSTTSSATPVAVSGALTLSAIALGRDHTCGLTIGGAPYCWGYNLLGQLGDGSTTSSATPVAVSGGLSFSATATGGNHSCGITSAGAVYCWGANDSGQLGDGTTTSGAIPVAVAGWP